MNNRLKRIRTSIDHARGHRLYRCDLCEWLPELKYQRLTSAMMDKSEDVRSPEKFALFPIYSYQIRSENKTGFYSSRREMRYAFLSVWWRKADSFSSGFD